MNDRIMDKKIKIQITLPSPLVEKIDKETQVNYTNKSRWFEKIVNFYFENKDIKEIKRNKKIINLDI